MSATSCLRVRRRAGRPWMQAVLALGFAFAATLSRAEPGVPWITPQAHSFSVGDALDINGVPMRLRGFVSEQSVDAVAKALLDRWPRPFTEDRVGQRRIFGRMADGHLLTVQIEATPGGGTRGLSAATPMREALRADLGRESHEALRHLPVGSTLVQQQRSVDGDRTATVVVARNHFDPTTNAEHLIERLQADGFVLERRGRQPVDAVPAADAPRGEVLMFSAGRRQAMAVVSRDRRGESTVLLTTSSPRESTR